MRQPRDMGDLAQALVRVGYGVGAHKVDPLRNSTQKQR